MLGAVQWLPDGQGGEQGTALCQGSDQGAGTRVVGGRGTMRVDVLERVR